MSDTNHERLRPCRAAEPAWLFLLITLMLGVGKVWGHELSRSESVLSISDATVGVQFSINLLEFRGVDANGDGRVSYDELDARIEDVFGAVKQHYILAAASAPARVVMERQQIVEDHVFQADLVYTFDQPVRELRVSSTLDAVTAPGHAHYVRAAIGGETYQALLTPESRTAVFLVGGVTFGRLGIVLLAVVGIAAWLFRQSGRRSTHAA